MRPHWQRLRWHSRLRAELSARMELREFRVRGHAPGLHVAQCDTAGGGRYCGKVGDGCGGTLDCPTACPQVGWVCQDNLCGAAGVCTKITCATATGDHYCGKVADKCGGSLDCGDCAGGWTCGTDYICKGGPDVCTKAELHDLEWGSLLRNRRDNCGGTLECGDDCPLGWTCGKDSICKGGLMSVRQSPVMRPNGDHYCGTIGDKCVCTLECGATCPKANWVCDDHMCKGDLTTCTPLTCAASSGGQLLRGDRDGLVGRSPVARPAPRPAGCAKAVCARQGPMPIAYRRPAHGVRGSVLRDIGDGCGIKPFTATRPVRKTAGSARTSCAGPSRRIARRSAAQPELGASNCGHRGRLLATRSTAGYVPAGWLGLQR